MPELPEVETVRRGLEEILRERPRILRVELMREDIRWPIPKDLPSKLKNAMVTGVRRRAKYLLIDTEGVSLLCHLGMTGSWRIAEVGDDRVHDHCYIHLSDGRRLAFSDPRRFGMLDWLERSEESSHSRLRALGPEPFDETKWTAEYLFERSRKRAVLIKSLIMDQEVVVGVGNIYASEALFRAKIKPTRIAGKITRHEAALLVQVIREVLAEAISAGGSTIRDFRAAGGSEGYFQSTFRVYDRAGEPCPECKKPIRLKNIGGRSSFYCSSCQK